MVEVIDASVAIKWFINEDGQDLAMGILSKVISEPQGYCVPELFFFELSHVFNRMLKSPTAKQKYLFEQTLKFGIHRFSMSPKLFELVCQFQSLGLSGYDAAYVAVAKFVGGKWITFDKKAHRKIASLHLSKCLGE